MQGRKGSGDVLEEHMTSLQWTGKDHENAGTTA